MKRIDDLRLALVVVLVSAACGGGNGSDPDADVGPAGPTVHDEDIVANETWSAATAPHIVDGCLTIGGSTTEIVTVTIEAGVEVRFTAGGCLIVGETDMRGALVAEGASAEPILFTSDQQAGAQSAGYWDAIIFGQDAEPSTVLDHTIIEYGGRAGSGAHSGPNWVDAMVIAWGNSDALPALSIKNTTVRQSSTDGMAFESGARFAADSAALIVTDNEGYPVHIEAGSTHTLPTDGASDYTGNGTDVIYLLDGNGYELASGSPTWSDPGVSYLISNNIDVNGAAWTVATGVTVAGAAGAEIQVLDGTLTADGATFTSESDSVYWGGIFFDPPGTGSLQNCTVERGGANFGGNSDGFNIYVESGAVALPTISGCTVSDSVHDGIATWDVPVATYQGNTFSNNADWDIYDYFNDAGWNQ
jgi:hypothetical protein